jgi:hypothetical protein
MVGQLFLKQSLDNIFADFPQKGVKIIKVLNAFLLEKLFEFIVVKYHVTSLKIILSKRFTQILRLLPNS